MNHPEGTLGWFREMTTGVPDDAELVVPGHKLTVEVDRTPLKIGALSRARVILGEVAEADDCRIRMARGELRVVCKEARRMGSAYWSKVYTNAGDLIVEKKHEDSLGQVSWREVDRFKYNGDETDKILYFLLSNGASVK